MSQAISITQISTPRSLNIMETPLSQAISIAHISTPRSLNKKASQLNKRRVKKPDSTFGKRRMRKKRYFNCLIYLVEAIDN